MIVKWHHEQLTLGRQQELNYACLVDTIPCILQSKYQQERLEKLRNCRQFGGGGHSVELHVALLNPIGCVPLYVKSLQLNKSVNTWLVFVAALYRSRQRDWCRLLLRISVPFSAPIPFICSHISRLRFAAAFFFRSVRVVFVFPIACNFEPVRWRIGQWFSFQSNSNRKCQFGRSGRTMLHALWAFIEKCEEIPVARSICGNPISTCPCERTDSNTSVHGDYVRCAGARQATGVKNRKQLQGTWIRFWACRLHVNCSRTAVKQKTRQTMNEWTR